MPELPDITVYVERAQERLQGQVLRKAQLLNPFVLRTALPPIAQAEGRTVVAVQRQHSENHTLKRALTDPHLFSCIVQVQSESETNYCARRQTGGRLLADRALSTLLKKGWPKTEDDL